MKPTLRRFTPAILMVAVFVSLSGVPRSRARFEGNAEPGTIDTLTFHIDAQRTGWNPNETVLTPAAVASGQFGPLWESPQFDSVTIGSTTYEPHIYASPLYVNGVAITDGPYAGSRFSVIFAATSNGFVYAVNAFASADEPPVPPGTILWQMSLGRPTPVVDGGVPLGVQSTPVIDLNTNPPRLYVAADVTDAARNWQVFALDLGSGAVLEGWPLIINDATLAPINQNGPARFQATSVMSQRGALNLSPDGRLLYVPFGAYGDGGAGWLVAVDTVTPSLASAFSGAPSMAATANGGMWGSAGPAIDAAGNVYVTTGNSPSSSHDAPGVWGESLLVWGADPILQLVGTYTPFNYCAMDQFDVDLSGGSPIVLPELDPETSGTPRLVAFGGKQGNAYLVDRDNLPGMLDRRPPCSTDSTTDRSLLPPDPQPQFGARGPLNIFGPYSENSNQGDFAKARSMPAAYFRSADNTSYLYFSGSTKVAVGSRDVRPPSLIRVRVVTTPGEPGYPSVDGVDSSMTYLSPGSPIVTSNGSEDAIVWMLDANLFRSQSLRGPSVPHPVLYAVDAMTLDVLWRSTPDQLNVGGKYNHPTIARGVVFVGTDRIQAFGLSGVETGRTARNTGRNHWSH